jgi:hypothetical protein
LGVVDGDQQWPACRVVGQRGPQSFQQPEGVVAVAVDPGEGLCRRLPLLER